MRGYSIRSQLNALILGVGLLAFVVIADRLYRDYYYIHHDVVKDHLQITQGAAQAGENFLQNSRAMLGAISLRLDVHRMDANRCDEVFSQINELELAHVNYLLVDPQGKIICSAVKKAGEVYAAPEGKLAVQQALSSNRFTLSEPHHGPVTGRWVAWAVLPLLNAQSQPNGALVASIDLFQFEAVLADVYRPQDIQFTLLSSQGVTAVSAQTSPDELGQKATDNGLLHAYKADQSCFTAQDDEGERKLFCVVELSGSSWRVISEARLSDVYVPLWNRARDTVLFLLIPLTTILLIGMLLNRQIAQPIQVLAQAAQKAAAGDLSVRASPNGPLEIAAVADEFNHLLVSRLQAEQELQRVNDQLQMRERMLSTLMDSLPGVVYRCKDDVDWTMEFISQGCLDLTGYPAEDLLNNARLSYASLILAEDRQRVNDEIHSALAERRSYQLEYRIQRRNGALCWVWERGQGIFDENSQTQALEGLIIDVTERKQIEEELRASQEKLRLNYEWLQIALETARAGVWEWDLRNNRIYWSDENYRLMGLSPGEARASYETWLSRILEDDRARVDQGVQAFLAEGDRLELEYRLMWPDGSLRWMIDRGRVYRDENGAPTRVVGVQIDVTEVRQIQQDYRDLFEILPDGFAVHEMLFDDGGRPQDYRFLAVNPAFERLTGLQLGEIIGKTARQILPGLEDFWINTYGKVVSSGETARFQHFAEALQKHYEVTAYRSGENQFAVVFLDITQRIHSEEQLRRREQILRAVSEIAGRFLLGVDWEADVRLLLERLGEVTSSHHAHLFENYFDPTGALCLRNLFSWTSQNTAQAAMQSPANFLSYEEMGLERWVEVMSVGEAIAGAVSKLPLREQMMFAPLGVRSIAAIPVFAGREWCGFISFADCRTERPWSAAEVDALQTAAGILGASLERKKIESALLQREEDLMRFERLIVGRELRMAELKERIRALEHELAARKGE